MTHDIRSASEGRWFGTGFSTLADPAKAGAEAASAAVSGDDPVVVFVFCSIGYQVPALFDAIRAHVAPETVIVGCSTSGQLVAGDVAREGVAISAWGGPGFTARTHVARDASTRLREAGAEVAVALNGITNEHRALVMMCDGLTGNQHEIVRGAFSQVGAAVPLVGACAGDDITYVQTYQFHGTGAGVEIMSDAVVGIGIGSDKPIGIGIAHGWRKDGPAMVVTSSKDSRVYELDGEPALDVLLRRLGMDESVVDDGDAFRDIAFLHPLGLSRRSGEDLRVIHAGDRSDRSLLCLADVPQGALAWLMEGDHESLLDGASRASGQALEVLGGQPPLGLLMFDCAARRVMLGDEGIEQENAEIVKAVGAAPFAGFYTNGEIARVRGALGMHHFTLVTLALA